MDIQQAIRNHFRKTWPGLKRGYEAINDPGAQRSWDDSEDRRKDDWLRGVAHFVRVLASEPGIREYAERSANTRYQLLVDAVGKQPATQVISQIQRVRAGQGISPASPDAGDELSGVGVARVRIPARPKARKGASKLSRPKKPDSSAQVLAAALEATDPAAAANDSDEWLLLFVCCQIYSANPPGVTVVELDPFAADSSGRSWSQRAQRPSEVFSALRKIRETAEQVRARPANTPVPLNEKQQVVYQFLLSKPEHEAVSVTSILNQLQKHGIYISEGTLRTNYISVLMKHYGAANSPRKGYRIPQAARPVR